MRAPASLAPALRRQLGGCAAGNATPTSTAFYMRCKPSTRLHRTGQRVFSIAVKAKPCGRCAAWTVRKEGVRVLLSGSGRMEHVELELLHRRYLDQRFATTPAEVGQNGLVEKTFLAILAGSSIERGKNDLPLCQRPGTQNWFGPAVPAGAGDVVDVFAGDGGFCLANAG
jgi:hypothetical protein